MSWWSSRPRGTQQLQTIPPLHKSKGLLPENTHDKLRPHSYWWPWNQQWFGTAAKKERTYYQAGGLALWLRLRKIWSIIMMIQRENDKVWLLPTWIECTENLKLHWSNVLCRWLKCLQKEGCMQSYCCWRLGTTTTAAAWKQNNFFILSCWMLMT